MAHRPRERHPAAAEWAALAQGELSATVAERMAQHLRGCPACLRLFVSAPAGPVYFGGRPFPGEMVTFAGAAVRRLQQEWSTRASAGETPVVVTGSAVEEGLLYAAKEDAERMGVLVEVGWNGEPGGDVVRRFGEKHWRQWEQVLTAGPIETAAAAWLVAAGEDLGAGWEAAALGREFPAVREAGAGAGCRTIPGRWAFRWLAGQWAEGHQDRVVALERYLADAGCGPKKQLDADPQMWQFEASVGRSSETKKG
jgi:hypothetical protein